MPKILIASHNKGKLAEFKALLEPKGFEIVSAAELDLPDVEETGTTFEENAIIKAKAFAQSSGIVCLADDSGLCVDALNGAPGVFSARYAPNRDFDKGMDKLIAAIEATGSSDWSAHFSCVIAVVTPTGETKTFEGRVDGKIIKEKRGTGFGYDPIFMPNGHNQTFGELSGGEKNKISHRARALQKFMENI